MRKLKGLVDKMEISETKSGDHFFWWPNFIVTTVCRTFRGKKSLLLCKTRKQACCSFSFVSFFLLFFLSPLILSSSLFFLSSSSPLFIFPILISSYPYIFLSFFLKPLPFLSRFKLRRSGGVVCRCLRTGSNKAFSPSVCWPAGFPHRLSCLQFTLSVWTGELRMGLNFNDFSKYLSS